MLNKIMKKALMLAGLFLAFGQLSHATNGVTVSSTTNLVFNSPNGPIPFVFLIRPGESATASIISTAPLALGCTINLEIATNFSNFTVIATTATGMGGLNTLFTFNIPNVQQFSQIRFNILTSTNSQGFAIPITYTISDNDDTVSVLKNSKSQDSVYFNDDSVQVLGAIKPDIYQYQVANSSPVQISSFTQINWRPVVRQDKTYGPAQAFSTNSWIVDKTYVRLTSTGTATLAGAGERGLTLSACPTITTGTAVTGDRIVFECEVDSITFSDAASGPTVGGATTALRLGAATRACGFGDTLGLVYLNGFWREEYFTNAITE